MNVCVAGLWHLGSVTAACLARGGHVVMGYDDEPTTVERLRNGRPPIFEPGLAELTRHATQSGQLRFTTDPVEALHNAEVVWITWETPVDADDRADVGSVVEKVERLLAYVQRRTLIIVSSQLPVGTTARLERSAADRHAERHVSFAYSPENLRLGNAIEAFTKPDRVVVGMRHSEDGPKVTALLAPFTDCIQWMSVESAEMTKHALNAFLATSVAFINEVAALCERVGADAAEVARGLKSDNRIGPRAYLAPGAAFAGGTLARDVMFLDRLGEEQGRPLHLIPAVRVSNEAHRQWAAERLESELGDLAGKTVAVWGLTYKPGTDTLRRSSALALCKALAGRGVMMRAFDPSITELPPDVAASVMLAASPTEAARGADAVVVATEWPVFREIAAEDLVSAGAPVVLDAGRFLASTLGIDGRLRYLTVGSPR